MELRFKPRPFSSGLLFNHMLSVSHGQLLPIQVQIAACFKISIFISLANI